MEHLKSFCKILIEDSGKRALNQNWFCKGGRGLLHHMAVSFFSQWEKTKYYCSKNQECYEGEMWQSYLSYIIIFCEQMPILYQYCDSIYFFVKKLISVIFDAMFISKCKDLNYS